jgi:hypothetical protein
MTTTSIPASITEWLSTLAPRQGWMRWEGVGNSVREGVQNWSAVSSHSSSVGVWGNVVDEEETGTPSVQWCVYVNDCRDPEKSGFASAAAAMAWAERVYPDVFPAERAFPNMSPPRDG